MGRYGQHFAQSASNVTWVGLDGAEGIEEATSGRVRFADLAEGLPYDIRAHSWTHVLSIEVAEHVPRASEGRFVHNLLAPRPSSAVVLSWSADGPPPSAIVASCASDELEQRAARADAAAICALPPGSM